MLWYLIRSLYVIIWKLVVQKIWLHIVVCDASVFAWLWELLLQQQQLQQDFQMNNEETPISHSEPYFS